MRKGDVLFILILAGIISFIMVPATHSIFIDATTSYPLAGGFVKFAVLATMGELLAMRIVTGGWKRPSGILYRILIWGLLGVVITLMFTIFSGGVTVAVEKGLLPGEGSRLAFAFFVSLIMNAIFAPTFMAFHRVTDTIIDMKYEGHKDISIGTIVDRIDWKGFIGFVVLKTIPLFWIPAHTVTFLLPAEYRVLVAAMLSLVLGVILSFAKRRAMTGQTA